MTETTVDISQPLLAIQRRFGNATKTLEKLPQWDAEAAPVSTKEMLKATRNKLIRSEAVASKELRDEITKDASEIREWVMEEGTKRSDPITDPMVVRNDGYFTRKDANGIDYIVQAEDVKVKAQDPLKSRHEKSRMILLRINDKTRHMAVFIGLNYDKTYDITITFNTENFDPDHPLSQKIDPLDPDSQMAPTYSFVRTQIEDMREDEAETIRYYCDHLITNVVENPERGSPQ